MRFSLWALACAVFVAASLHAAPTNDAARVAIIQYVDKTGTTNFGYMPHSLQEAITKSMHRKFEFIEIKADKVEPIAAKVRAQAKGKLTAKDAAEICRLADIDILIYGNFTFSETTKAISINTEISLGSTDKFRTLQPVDNRVDATIFGAADRVAGDIVQEITKVAAEQQKARGEEANKKGKTQLVKTEKSKTWADTNWMISPNVGMYTALVSRDNAYVHTSPGLNFSAMYRLKGNWHVGVSTSFSDLKSSSSSSSYSTDIQYLGTTANIGYFFDLSARWRLTTLLGAGYYFGKYSVYTNCASYNTMCDSANIVPETKIHNPYFTARAGIHFLVFSFLSLGIEGEYRMLYDSTPVQAAGAAASISLVF